MDAEWVNGQSVLMQPVGDCSWSEGLSLWYSLYVRQSLGLTFFGCL